MLLCSANYIHLISVVQYRGMLIRFLPDMLMFHLEPEQVSISNAQIKAVVKFTFPRQDLVDRTGQDSRV